MKPPQSALRGIPLLVLLPLLLSGGCRDADTDLSGRLSLTDSAGVAVVEVLRPVWGEGEGWTVDPEPRLRIGEVAGAPEEELHQVADAVLRPDGSVILADGGSGEIRVFDASGGHVRSFARQGDGPGELRAVRGLRLEGDTLLVYDAGPGRITRFGLDGELLGATTLEVPEGRRPPAGVAWLPGGGVVGDLSWPDPSEGFRTAPEGELRRQPRAFLRFEPGGRLADTLLVRPGSEVFRIVSQDAGVFRSMETSPPFGRVSVWSGTGPDGADGPGVWVGTGDGYELRFHGRDGALRRIVRHPGGEIPLEPARIDSARASALEGLDDSPRVRRMVELLYRPDRQPSTLPPYSAVMVDGEGHVWVREYEPPEGRPVRWDVFRPDGALLGAVELPVRFRPFRIGSDRVLGVRTDELDVQRVEVLELRR